jgi:hypothetical protein
MFLAAIYGCGQGQATVSGKVTYRNNPVTYGSVTFLGPDDKAASAAIGPDGSYTVEGLTPGEARIGVTSRDPSKGRTSRKATNKDSANEPPDTGKNGWVPLPRQVESAANSGLTCTLKSGSNTHDINLEPTAPE